MEIHNEITEADMQKKQLALLIFSLCPLPWHSSKSVVLLSLATPRMRSALNKIGLYCIRGHRKGETTPCPHPRLAEFAHSLDWGHNLAGNFLKHIFITFLQSDTFKPIFTSCSKSGLCALPRRHNANCSLILCRHTTVFAQFQS